MSLVAVVQSLESENKSFIHRGVSRRGSQETSGFYSHQLQTGLPSIEASAHIT